MKTPTTATVSYSYATPEIKATATYQAAEAAETLLALEYPKLFTGSDDARGDRSERFTAAALAWEAAGFFGWADNYRAALRF